MAVDVGLEGLLRRIGIAKPLKALLRIFKIILPAKFVLWDEVETINFSRLDIHLSKTLSKLNTLHPSDLADIIEDLDRQTQIALFSSMDMERAADILEEMEPDEQADIIENLPVDMAADLLEKMPADEAADLLDELKDDKVEELLNEMDREASEEVRELMEYEDNEVGSLMSTDFLSFSQNQSISDVLSQLRRDKPESLYSLFVFDKKDRLIGTVSLRDLIISEPEIMLKDVMNTKFNYVHDNDKTKSLAEMISKYNLLAVPVVNQEMQMLGTVIVDDVLDELMD
jgi:Mg/Co/Ni transporter MgtE